jgi:hypothetical protein
MLYVDFVGAGTVRRSMLDSAGPFLSHIALSPNASKIANMYRVGKIVLCNTVAGVRIFLAMSMSKNCTSSALSTLKVKNDQNGEKFGQAINKNGGLQIIVGDRSSIDTNKGFVYHSATKIFVRPTELNIKDARESRFRIGSEVKYRPHLDTSEINSSHAQTTCRRCEFRAEAPTSRNSHPALQQTSAGS